MSRGGRMSSRTQPADQSNRDRNRAVGNSPRTEDRPDESNRDCDGREKWPDARPWHFFFVLWFGIEAVGDQHLGNVFANSADNGLIGLGVPQGFPAVHSGEFKKIVSRRRRTRSPLQR